MFTIPTRWYGSQESYAQLVSRMQYLELNPGAISRAMYHPDDEDENESVEEMLASDLIEYYGSVGVITVKGKLVNSESWINTWLDAVGYPTIIRAVDRLLNDESVSAVVTSYATGGGTVEGVGDAGDSMKAAGLVKPIYSHTGSAMLSAGYWLGATGRQVRASKMAETGSIGAVATFMGIAKMLQKEGIEPYVSRSTPKKGIPHPYELLTEAGKQAMDETTARLHGFFIEHVTANRPQLSAVDAKSGWASGECFSTAEAVSLGLVDGPPITLNDLIAEVDKAHNTENLNSGENQMTTRIVLRAEKDRAAVAAGVPIADVGMAEEVTELTTGGDGVVDSTVLTDSVPVVTRAADEPDAGIVSESAGGGDPEAGAGTVSEDGLTVYLKDENKTLKNESSALTAKVAHLESELLSAKQSTEQLEALRPAVEQAVERLQVGLGHRPMNMSAFPVDTLLVTYNQLYAELMALPVGRHSTGGEPSDRADSQAQSSMGARRLQLIS